MGGNGHKRLNAFDHEPGDPDADQADDGAFQAGWGNGHGRNAAEEQEEETVPLSETAAGETTAPEASPADTGSPEDAGDEDKLPSAREGID